MQDRAIYPRRRVECSLIDSKEKNKSPEIVWSLLSPIAWGSFNVISYFTLPHLPRHPSEFVLLASLSAQDLLTGIFFCAMATTQSLPRMATVVKPPWLIALKAYSTSKRRSLSGTDRAVMPKDTYRLGRADLRERRWWYHDRNRRKLFDSSLRSDLQCSFLI